MLRLYDVTHQSTRSLRREPLRSHVTILSWPHNPMKLLGRSSPASLQRSIRLASKTCDHDVLTVEADERRQTAAGNVC